MAKNKTKQTYRYRKSDSILQGENDYALKQDEYYLLYKFFVTYSVCPNQSFQTKSYIDYGWDTNNIECYMNEKRKDTDLGATLKRYLDLRSKKFVFTEKDDLKVLFSLNGLPDNLLPDYDTERAVIGITNVSNKYNKLFYRIRNCLAHGKFILKYSSHNEKMMIFQDNDKDNVTARIVLKLKTLIDLICAIDKNGLIVENIKNNKNETAA